MWGGYLLSNIDTDGKKIGVEINSTACEVAIKNGIECYETLKLVSENSIDVVVSNHVLEHVDEPLDILKELKRVVKPGGKIVIVVPHEVNRDVNVNDVNMHLYTWSPQNMYNLFKEADINIIECKRISHKWVNHYQKIQKIFGWNIFHLMCGWNCLIKHSGYQTCIVGSVDV